MSSAAVVIGALRVNLNIGTCFSGGKSANSVANIWNNAGAVNENGDTFREATLQFSLLPPLLLGINSYKRMYSIRSKFFPVRVDPIF